MRRATIELRKTGYYVTYPDGSSFADATGHSWFTKRIALETACRIGGWYEKGNTTTTKEVVTGYYDVPEDGGVSVRL